MNNIGPAMTLAELTELMNKIDVAKSTPQIVATQGVGLNRPMTGASGALNWLGDDDGVNGGKVKFLDDHLESTYQLKYLKKQIIETTHDIDNLMHAVNAPDLTPDTIRSLISSMQQDLSILYNLTGTFSSNVYQAIQDAPNE